MRTIFHANRFVTKLNYFLLFVFCARFLSCVSRGQEQLVACDTTWGSLVSPAEWSCQRQAIKPNFYGVSTGFSAVNVWGSKEDQGGANGSRDTRLSVLPVDHKVPWVLCYANCTVPILDKLHVDDPVGAISPFMAQGPIWGMLAVGLFVERTPHGAESWLTGLFFRRDGWALLESSFWQCLVVTRRGHDHYFFFHAFLVKYDFVDSYRIQCCM
ncbi:hypothetical protein CEXT_814441 [Caerostris extrusa]|uniref:Uncharacterized protein n=1 Tax=Caerostris extrusa TaxID=172846 RepID=A0AAV4P5H7_CAEEX|nr:hypothetical protein CEXT_814441 [Caerostris extrusa]